MKGKTIAACTQWYPLSHATWSPLLAPQWLVKKSGTASHAISIIRDGGLSYINYSAQ